MFAPPEEQIETVRKNGSTVMFGETHFIYRLTKVMEKTYDLSALGMRTLFLSTSYASPVMIDYLGRTWNARISTHYGMTEMGLGLAVDCPICGAYHFNELDVIGEVIDPATGEALPPGSVGELVFTTLQRDAMPFIRYRTRDLAPFGLANEDCRSPLHTIGHVKSRIESLVRLRNGFTLHPTLFHDALFSIPEVIDYELTVDTRDGGDLVTVNIEADRPDGSLRDRIIDALRNDPTADELKRAAAPVEVHFREPGSLQQGAHFKKVVTDRRQQPVSNERLSPEGMAARMIDRAEFITL
jgi:phenylacetate-coenzyme A ligase PaaK-like adenylate-forming protein